MMYPLTRPQLSIYEMIKTSDPQIAGITGSILLQGQGNPEHIARAIRLIMQRNDALRMRVVQENSVPVQSVVDYTDFEPEILTFASRQELKLFADELAQQPIPLDGPLCKLTGFLLPDGYGLIASLNHIIGDAWTLTLIGSQFAQCCTALDKSEEPEITAHSYLDYIEAEQAYLNSPRWEKDRAFWGAEYAACPEVTYLDERESKSRLAQRETVRLSAQQTKLLKRYCQDKGESLFALFLCAWGCYINCTKDSTQDFFLGTAVLNRSGPKEKNTMGMFINTAPVRFHLDETLTFEENLTTSKKQIFSIFRHQKYNYSDILKDIRAKHGFAGALYDVMLSYQNATITGEAGTFETTWHPCGMQNETLQIHIDDRDGRGELQISYDFLTEKLKREQVRAIHARIMTLLTDAIQRPEAAVKDLRLLPAEEKALLDSFNDTAADYPKDKTIHQLFEEQVERTPDKVALIACDKTLTYRELNEAANRIAHGLIAEGVCPGDPVAFILPRTSRIIATMLGILKAGAAYVPIDPDYPQERKEMLLREGKVKFSVTKENVGRLLIGSPLEQSVVVDALSPYCALHTSGSTGTPKLSALSHHNIANFIQANRHWYADLQSVCAFTICTFDAFILETIVPLVHGVPAALAAENEIYDQTELEALLEKHNNTLMFATPTKLKQYLVGTKQRGIWNHVKRFIVGGEIFTEELLALIRKEAPRAEAVNIYGPTETSICATTMVAEPGNINIGKPIGNVQIYIVDKHMNPTPIGVTGELCIAGDGVGLGYLNRPELTAEKFIPNPFGKGKLYKTGDLAYWREDGNIVYVGRNDFQVKIRGLRIELGEIENALQEVDGVTQAVVVVRKNAEGRQLICAFYTGQELEAKVLRSAIGQRLPKYMLPHSFTHLDTMPLTSSGKVNRNALPEVDLSQLITGEYVRPEGELERQLASPMEQVLDYTPIGREDNFFDLGGDSLKAIEFVSKAHSEGIYIPLQNVFDYPTVQKLAECIQSGNTAQRVSFEDVDFSEINKLLAKNTLEQAAVPPRQEAGNLLLAGATGYLGIHLLADYLEHDNGTAYCLVRGANQAESEKRLVHLLGFYFEGKYADLIGSRIRVLCGDLQKDKLGLTEQSYADLQGRVDTVINAAASVKHYGSYRYFYEVNMETTQRLIDFCMESGAKLVHISTLSVSGNGFETFDGYVSQVEKFFSESDLYIIQPLENVYARSKFEAELAVLEAMSRGLRANVMRMGNLTNRSSDGVFQINHESNAAAQRIKGMLELGCVPDYLISEDDMYVEFTPIDEAAQAVMTITRQFSTEQTVFHINSTKVVYLDKLIEYFTELGYPVKVVSGAEFTAALRQSAKNAGTEHIFETFINDLDANDRLNYESNIHIENGFTEEYLRRLGFAWGEVGMEYLKKYIEHFKRIKFLNTPAI